MVAASFFDIDGTLTKGYMLTRFAKHLMSKKLFQSSKFDQIMNLRCIFDRGDITYREAVEKLPKIFAEGFKGNIIQKVDREAQVFANMIINSSLFPYSKSLVKLMKSFGLTFALSGGPQEVINELGRFLSIDESYGTELVVSNHRYTGELYRNLTLREIKENLFNKLVEKHNIDLRRSFAFGDTEQDLAFLLKVGNPIAVNPNQGLLRIAKEKGWTICQSEKAIIEKIKSRLDRLR